MWVNRGGFIFQFEHIIDASIHLHMGIKHPDNPCHQPEQLRLAVTQHRFF